MCTLNELIDHIEALIISPYKSFQQNKITKWIWNNLKSAFENLLDKATCDPQEVSCRPPVCVSGWVGVWTRFTKSEIMFTKKLTFYFSSKKKKCLRHFLALIWRNFEVMVTLKQKKKSNGEVWSSSSQQKQGRFVFEKMKLILE